jgi:hypothetical protein
MPDLSRERPQVAHVVAFETASSTDLEALAAVVVETPAFCQADEQSKVAAVEGETNVALIFFNSVEAPANCALEVLEKCGTPFKAGVHSGLIQSQIDISGNESLAGEGLTTARKLAHSAKLGEIVVSQQCATWLREIETLAPKLEQSGERVLLRATSVTGQAEAPQSLPSTGKKIVLLYRRRAEPDEEVLSLLEGELQRNGYDVFIDRHLRIGVEWAKEIEQRIRQADAVVAIVSPRALQSEMIEYELETANDQYQKSGKPLILPVKLSREPAEGPIGAIVNPINGFEWSGPEDNQRLIVALLSAMTEPLKVSEDVKLEPVGGAVPPDSPFYVRRAADDEFLQAIRDQESIILLKGPRQIGKTSLEGQGVKLVKELGWRHAITDFQKLGSAQLASDEVFLKLLAATLGRQLGFKYDFENEWMDVFGAGLNMETFLRELLDSSSEPLVWFMDEVDKVFGAPLASDFFGLVRSWHNSRSTEPGGPWDKLTVVIGYATEAHLFIQDLNQSPFNVGRRIDIEDFNLQQLVDLNNRYGGPLKSYAEVEQLQDLIGGQPFLTRRALDVLARGKMTLSDLVAQADQEDGPFGDHLKRILISVTRFEPVERAMKEALRSGAVSETDSFYRLAASGVVKKAEGGAVVPRCSLYLRYLSAHLK